MNEVLGNLYAQIGYTGPGEPPEDGETNETTLLSRHRTRHSKAEHATSRSLKLPTILNLCMSAEKKHWFL